MKNSKKVLTSVILVSLTFSSIPSVFASETSEVELTDANRTTSSQSTATCEEKLSKVEMKASDNEAARLGKFNDRKADQDTKIVNKRSENDAQKTIHRENVSTKVAGNPEVKAIIDKFQQAVNAALKARRDGNDAALAAFRTTMTGLEATRKLAVDTAFATLKSAACTTDKAANKLAWAAYRESVSAARAAFRTGAKTALGTLTAARVTNRDTYLKTVAAATKEKKDALAALKASTATPAVTQ